MSERYISWLLVFLLFVVAVASMCATLYYLWRAFTYRFHEFVACVFAAFCGVTSYVLAKRLGFEMRVEGQLTAPVEILKEAPFWWALGLGAFCGLFYGRQLRELRLATFRWALIVLCWAHAVTIELLMAVMGDARGTDILGAVFVMALSLVGVAQIPGWRKGTVIDPDEDEASFELPASTRRPPGGGESPRRPPADPF